MNEETLDVFTRRLVVSLPTPVSYSDGGRGGLEADLPLSHRRDRPLGIGPLQPARPTSRRQPPRGPLEYSEAPDERAAVENMATYKRKMANETSAILR